MKSPRTGFPRQSTARRLRVWAGLAVLGLAPATGCQVDYAGMTLPSGKYMHDDVQYFAPGPDFPYANTQAATQRARIAAMGEIPPTPGVPMSSPAPFGGIGGAAGAGGGVPRPTGVPEIEAQAPGGPAAPNNVAPGVVPGAPLPAPNTEVPPPGGVAPGAAAPGGATPDGAMPAPPP